jgi:hypothetical protein
MLSQLTRHAMNRRSRLSSAASELFRRLTKPARPSPVTGTLANLPRGRAELLAENARWRQDSMILRRRTETPRLTWRERLSQLFLARWVSKWMTGVASTGSQHTHAKRLENGRNPRRAQLDAIALQ